MAGANAGLPELLETRLEWDGARVDECLLWCEPREKGRREEQNHEIDRPENGYARIAAWTLTARPKRKNTENRGHLVPEGNGGDRDDLRTASGEAIRAPARMAQTPLTPMTSQTPMTSLTALTALPQ